MDSIPKFIENKNNKDQIQYLIPQLEPILKDTYGTIVYQEQVMAIVREVAGYSFGRADLVRRAMSKKKHDVMEHEKDVFINGSLNADGSVDVEAFLLKLESRSGQKWLILLRMHLTVHTLPVTLLWRIAPHLCAAIIPTSSLVHC